MSLSKRQQARNERTLQDLIKLVSGNDVCADCQARNLGWASWSLGIFLCMRCAALHRKMGTHISKVKSLSMDTWTNEQVAGMQRVGNTKSNHIYNPNNTKPPIPMDADGADSAMERFIRQKYQQKSISSPQPQRRTRTGSSSDEGPPPPLPPKPTSRFGFGSASSIFPLSSKSRKNSAASLEHSSASLDQSNKQSKLLGTHVVTDEMDSKLIRLREMGFSDESRNAAVLKGLGGNMEKSIETLTRIGEGRNMSKMKPRQRFPPRSVSPVGFTIERALPRSPERSSTNPFDMVESPARVTQPQSSQSTGGNPYRNQSNNAPFGLDSTQSRSLLNDAFQSMTVTPSQRLFPNHTGGIPIQQPQHPQIPQSMTPPILSSYQMYPSVIYECSQQPHPNQQVPASQGYNPFIPQQPSQQTPTFGTNFQTMNPFDRVHPDAKTYQTTQIYNDQYHPTGHSNIPGQAPQEQMNPSFSPWQQQQPLQPPQQQSIYQDISQTTLPQFQQHRQQTLPPMIQQQTGRADKSTILDLYNHPRLTSQPLQPTQPGLGQSQFQQSTPPISGSHFSQPARSFSSPLATHMEINRNPFLFNAAASMQSSDNDLGTASPFAQQSATRNISRESMAIDAGGWQNGRHSPDAWATIARSMQ